MEQDKTGNVIVAATKVSSPIPPAEEMERYNNINPEIVTKIMDVYEAYSKHIQSIFNIKSKLLLMPKLLM